LPFIHENGILKDKPAKLKN